MVHRHRRGAGAEAGELVRSQVPGGGDGVDDVSPGRPSAPPPWCRGAVVLWCCGRPAGSDRSEWWWLRSWQHRPSRLCWRGIQRGAAWGKTAMGLAGWLADRGPLRLSVFERALRIQAVIEKSLGPRERGGLAEHWRHCQSYTPPVRVIWYPATCRSRSPESRPRSGPAPPRGPSCPTPGARGPVSTQGARACRQR